MSSTPPPVPQRSPLTKCQADITHEPTLDIKTQVYSIESPPIRPEYTHSTSTVVYYSNQSDQWLDNNVEVLLSEEFLLEEDSRSKAMITAGSTMETSLQKVADSVGDKLEHFEHDGERVQVQGFGTVSSDDLGGQRKDSYRTNDVHNETTIHIYPKGLNTSFVTSSKCKPAPPLPKSSSSSENEYISFDADGLPKNGGEGRSTKVQKPEDSKTQSVTQDIEGDGAFTETEMTFVTQVLYLFREKKNILFQFRESFCLVFKVNFFCVVIICHQRGLDPRPLHGADRNLVLSPRQRVDQQYRGFAPKRAYGQ